MSGLIDARLCLRRAEYFLRQANIVGVENEEIFSTYLAAAIVFARSGLFQLEGSWKEGKNSFGTWREAKETGDPLLLYFREVRNVTIHRGDLEVRRVTSEISEHSGLYVSFMVLEPDRIRAWYQLPVRSIPRRVWRNVQLVRARLQLWITLPYRGWQSRRQRERRYQIERYHFVDHEWSKPPAVDLVRQYIKTVGASVDQAEREQRVS